MTLSLKGSPNKAKEEAPSPHEVRTGPAGHQPSISMSRGNQRSLTVKGFIKMLL